jgi:hypothetical protein
MQVKEVTIDVQIASKLGVRLKGRRLFREDSEAREGCDRKQWSGRIAKDTTHQEDSVREEAFESDCWL